MNPNVFFFFFVIIFLFHIFFSIFRIFKQKTLYIFIGLFIYTILSYIISRSIVVELGDGTMVQKNYCALEHNIPCYPYLGDGRPQKNIFPLPFVLFFVVVFFFIIILFNRYTVVVVVAFFFLCCVFFLLLWNTKKLIILCKQ